MKYNLFYIRTVPHTGSSFIVNLIREVANESVVYMLFNPDSTVKVIQNCFKRVIAKKLTFQECMCFLASEKDDIKNVFLAEHIDGGIEMPEKHREALILSELERQDYPGFPVKTLMSLRDYRLVTLTNFILSVNVQKGREEHLAWVRQAFNFMLEHYKKRNVMIIPVDLYGEKSIDDRCNLLLWLFDNFLNIDYDKANLISFAKKWQPAHSVFDNTKLEYYVGNKEFELLMSFRRDNNLLCEQRKQHPELDTELDYYDKHEGIQEMYRFFGYKM